MFDRRWLVAALLLAISLSISTVWIIAEEKDPQISKIEEIVENRYQQIDQWRFDARMILAMTIIVGLLGLAIGALQSFRGSWVKWTTVTVGLVVSSLTLIQNTVYKTDHHQFRRMANRAEQKLEEIELLLPEFDHADSEDWPILVDEIKKRIALIDEMEDQLLTGEIGAGGINIQSAAAMLPLIAIAEASPSPGEPDWVTAPPASKHAVYFVGLGADRSLAVAKKDALEDAYEQATDHFAFQAEQLGAAALEPDALSKRIVESARIESSHTAFDAGTGNWRYYTLIRIARSVIESSVEFFGIEKRQVVSEQLLMGLGRTDPLSADYFLQRKVAYDHLFASAEETLPTEVWETFEAARSLRRTGHAADAAEQLSEIVATHDRFYLAWYNRALALDDLGRYEDAATAYLRAIELEPEQAIRDASLYNTYGYLLYRMGRYREAIEPLEKALEIAPEHPKALRTLAASRRALADRD